MELDRTSASGSFRHGRPKLDVLFSVTPRVAIEGVQTLSRQAASRYFHQRCETEPSVLRKVDGSRPADIL
jgi:hypothetical protein